jgi:cellulose synthase/poly-beta-1,6-N-acetylglucosamine synthase-like glycosyltransferase
VTEHHDPGAVPELAGDRCLGHGDFLPYTAPPGLIKRRSVWLAPALMCSFVAAALGIHAVLSRLTFVYGRTVSEAAEVHSFELPKQASIAVRPLAVAVLLLFAVFAAGDFRARLRLAATAILIYLPLMFALDVLLARFNGDGGPSPFMARGNILDGLVAILAACLAVLSTAKLPANVWVPAIMKRPKYYLVILALSLAATVVTVMALFHYASHRLHAISTFPLLGGLFSVVVFFFVLFPTYLIVFGNVFREWRVTRGEEPSANITPEDTSVLTYGVMVPAHNEEGRIGDCIRAIDAAAGECTSHTTIYVIENGSTDATHAEAGAALAACRHAQGVLLTSRTPEKSRAKAHALNTGLAAATEDVLVRVDADTFVSESLLGQIGPYFMDPSVGGVGSVPLPHKVTIWIERMRSLEVYYGAAFKRTSQGAVDAIPVLPGATVAFRREILIRLGGFSEGMLGEDADITVRVGRLGYKIVSDPRIKVFSEQPQNFRELREQRMRWSGGMFHMIGRNRSAIYRCQGLRGVWTLPWGCFVMFRKLLLIPFAVAALGLIIIGHSFLPIHEVAAAGAIILGAQLAIMGLVVSILGGPSLLLSLPGYMVFRLIVTYFALETLLTIRLKDPRWSVPHISALGGRLRLPS